MHYDHITISTSPERFCCEICGAEQAVSLPVPLGRLEAQAAAFIAAHRDCPARLALATRHASHD